MSQKKIIYFILPSLEGGGSEKVISLITNNLNRKIFRVTIILAKKTGPYLSDLNSDINVIDLQTNRLRNTPFKIIKLLRKVKPDFVFSTLGHMNILLGIMKILIPKKTILIARESSIVSILNNKEKRTCLLNLLTRFFYKNFDKIICQSHFMKDDLVANYKQSASKIDVINNPIDFDSIREASESPIGDINNTKKYIVAVGRLSSEKRYDLLIQAFALLKKPNVNLYIVGEGIQLEYLKQCAIDCGVQKKVFFLGYKKNPYPYINSAECLIITSKYEGFPNVALEANACGKPVIGFRSPGGISEIVVNSKNGILVTDGDIKLLAGAIDSVFDNKFVGCDIKAITVKKYSLQQIVSQYEQSILSTVK